MPNLPFSHSWAKLLSAQNPILAPSSQCWSTTVNTNATVSYSKLELFFLCLAELHPLLLRPSNSWVSSQVLILTTLYPQKTWLHITYPSAKTVSIPNLVLHKGYRTILTFWLFQFKNLTKDLIKHQKSILPVQTAFITEISHLPAVFQCHLSDIQKLSPLLHIPNALEKAAGHVFHCLLL